MEAADDVVVCPAQCTRRVGLQKHMGRPFRHGSSLVPEEELGTQQAIKTISEKELTDSSGSSPPSVWPHSDNILTGWETNRLQRHGLSFTYHWKCWTGWPGVTAGSWCHLNLFWSALGYILACGVWISRLRERSSLEPLPHCVCCFLLVTDVRYKTVRPGSRWQQTGTDASWWLSQWVINPARTHRAESVGHPVHICASVPK